MQYFSAQGWTVFGLVRRNKAETEAKVEKEGLKNVTIFEADVQDAPALQKAAEGVSKITGGKLDIMINNAASLAPNYRWENLDEIPTAVLEEELTDAYRVNVIGVIFGTNAFLPLIRAGSMKKVITLATGMADLDLTNELDVTSAAAYSISKTATNMVVAKYNASYGKSEGILFLALSPGMVDTGMNGDAETEQAQKGMQKMITSFAKYAPHFKGPITVEESISAMVDVITKATPESLGGGFVSHHGDKNWL